jgi:hypothetical protein
MLLLKLRVHCADYIQLRDGVYGQPVRFAVVEYRIDMETCRNHGITESLVLWNLTRSSISHEGRRNGTMWSTRKNRHVETTTAPTQVAVYSRHCPHRD